MEGFEAYEERRKRKHDKQLDANVMIGSHAFDEGVDTHIDRNWLHRPLLVRDSSGHCKIFCIKPSSIESTRKLIFTWSSWPWIHETSLLAKMSSSFKRFPELCKSLKIMFAIVIQVFLSTVSEQQVSGSWTSPLVKVPYIETCFAIDTPLREIKCMIVVSPFTITKFIKFQEHIISSVQGFSHTNFC